MRLFRAFVLSFALRGLLSLGAGSSALFVSALVLAQSAADKGAARTLATDGIKAFQVGKYAEALDKLQRAQSLYDAPVHLLYIARAQVKLDKLVEGAETYRRLSRMQLEPGAAPAQKQAIETGNQELAELEPKIPTLRLDIEPATASGLEIRIDGEKVPVAIIGVDRPANPGSHKVQVWAPGFNGVEVTVDLSAGERKPVPLRLQPGSGAPPPGVAGTSPGTGPGQGPYVGPGAGQAAPSGLPPVEAPKKSRSFIGFMAGLRAGAAVPFGELSAQLGPVQNFVEPGGGAEIHAGLRFAKYFTGVLYFSRYIMTPGPKWHDLTAVPGDADAKNVASAEEGGIGLMVGSPRGQFGGYGEIDFALHRRFEVEQEITGAMSTCKRVFSLTSNGLRVGGGLQIPLAKFFHLSPFATVTVGPFAEVDNEKNGVCPPVFPNAKQKIQDPKPIGLFVVGVGGDFVFGNDEP